MKTLVIVAHPELKKSATQQFLLHQLPQDDNITWHELVNDQPFNIELEQKLLKEHDKIIFQFPLYWYSVPVNLRKWQDDVLTRGFAYGNNAVLGGKEFGVVVSLGEPIHEYEAGGKEFFTISELLKPLQAMANKLNWHYNKALVISQFDYLTDEQRLELIIKYQQYVTLNNTGFSTQQEWFLKVLKNKIKNETDENKKIMLNAIYDQLETNFDDLNELYWAVGLIRDDEE